MIYLDTHVVVWLYSGRLDLFPSPVKDAIDKNDLSISPIVLLELTYLKEIKKITVSAEKIFRALEDATGLKMCTHDFEAVARQACHYEWTRDPFDRIITAHAALTNSFLVTRDRNIQKHYKHVLWE